MGRNRFTSSSTDSVLNDKIDDVSQEETTRTIEDILKNIETLLNILLIHAESITGEELEYEQIGQERE